MTRRSTRVTQGIANRRDQVSKLYLNGYNIYEIGNMLKVTAATISGDLKAIREQWKLASVRNYEETIGQELQRLDILIRQYAEGYERSMQDKETVKIKSIPRKPKKTKIGGGRIKLPEPKPSPQEIERDVTRTGQAGDTRFLDGILACQDMRLKLKGIYEVMEVIHKGDPNQPVEHNVKVGLMDPTVFAKLPYEQKVTYLRQQMQSRIALVPVESQQSTPAGETDGTNGTEQV